MPDQKRKHSKMYNKIILIGNLTKDHEPLLVHGDPVLRFTPQGMPVASFTVAVNCRYKQPVSSRNEEERETMFIDTTVFGKQAESCSKYLNKGSAVFIEGRLREARWEVYGQKRSKFEVIAQSVRFLSRRKPEGPAKEGDTVALEETTDLEPF